MLVWASIGWVFASVGVAMLPVRMQYLPGMLLLLAAPVLIVGIALTVTWWVAALALAAVLSMYRNPLRYLWARFRGQVAEVPE
jgi:hypothetical protein